MDTLLVSDIPFLSGTVQRHDATKRATDADAVRTALPITGGAICLPALAPSASAVTVPR